MKKYMIVQTKTNLALKGITKLIFVVHEDNFETLESAKEYHKDMVKGYFIIMEYYD